MFYRSDVFVTQCSEQEFFFLIMKHHFAIYDLTIEEKITFCSKRKYRKQICTFIPLTQYRYTKGFLGQVERIGLKKERILVFVMMALYWWFLSHMIFEFQILGESDRHQLLIYEKIKEYHALPPFVLWDKQQLQDQLIQDLVQDIHWLTLHKQGSQLELHYLPKDSVIETEQDSRNLVAEKEGMIIGFDLKSGDKRVQVNQFVKKGDLLVSQVLVDSFNQEQITVVEGKVYAYTFQSLEVTIDKEDMPPFLDYYRCLFKIRQQLHDVLSDGERIVQEIPLIFEEKEDKIRMLNYYVLYEQIAVKE